MNPSGNRLAATLIGIVGIVLWAAETVLITFTTAIPPLQTVALAFAFAAALSPLAWAVTGDDPLAAFRQPLRVWVVMVGSLVGYHAAIYYATQQAPPTAAALLQGTTPLIIVLGSALLPGERLRWWHVGGAALGFAGILLLIGEEDPAGVHTDDPTFYLALVGVAAALWGLYSIVSRAFADVPTSALGAFYAASAAICFALHAGLEDWVSPASGEWVAIALLGTLPMGLALYLWDYGVKRGDIQALGAISYVEPFIGAALVAALGQGRLSATLLGAGVLVVAGAAMASRDLLFGRREAAADTAPGTAPAVLPAVPPLVPPTALPTGPADPLEGLEQDLTRFTADLLDRIAEHVRRSGDAPWPADLQQMASRTAAAWRHLDRERAGAADPPFAKRT